MGRGDLFVVSAPSGTGKTTLCQRLLGGLPGIAFSVSHTTRPARPGERDGRDYFFVSRQCFETMAAAGEFLEWALVHGDLYGTGRGQVMSRLDQGLDVLLDIDIQGARQVRQAFPDACLIFILPPALSVLEQRLRSRGSEEEVKLGLRLANARGEIRAASGYDYAVVNDDLEEAASALKAIVVAQRLRARRVLSEPSLRRGLGLA